MWKLFRLFQKEFENNYELRSTTKKCVQKKTLKEKEAKLEETKRSHPIKLSPPSFDVYLIFDRSFSMFNLHLYYTSVEIPCVGGSKESAEKSHRRARVGETEVQWCFRITCVLAQLLYFWVSGVLNFKFCFFLNFIFLCFLNFKIFSLSGSSSSSGSI